MAQDPFEPYLQQADDLFAAGDVVKAGQIWQAILKRVPAHPEARTGLARVKTYFGVRATQEEESRSTLSKRPQVQPSPASAPLLDQGTALYDGGQVEEALEVWERLLVVDPTHILARGYANMARSLLGKPLLEAPPVEPAPPPIAARDPQQTAPRIGGSTMVLPAPQRPAPPEPEPEPEPELPPDMDDEETLLRNGCLLFDMGQPEDALLRWERLLQVNPRHAQAREYTAQVRKQLNLPPLEPTVAPWTPEPAPLEVMSREDDFELLDRLLREGVQLFDMGMTEEALAKWEAVLAKHPDHADAQGYIAMARREPGKPSSPPPPPPVPDPLPAPVAEALPPTRAERRRDIQNTLAQADRLMQLQRYEEAIQLYDRILQADPDHQEALHRYQTARALAQAAAEPPPAAPLPVTPPPPPAPEPPVATPLALPATAVETPQPRGGLELPESLARLPIPPWARAPKTLAMAAGVLLVSITITLLVNQRVAESKLRSQVDAAKQDALSHALRATVVPVLAESPETLLKDAESQIPASPLMGYLRAQALMALQPDHPAGPALLERARTLLASSPAPAGTLEDADAKAKAGDFEGTQALLLALLRHAPDDGEIRSRTFRVTAHLVQLYALQERWDSAREGLRLMRALAPEDRSLPARLRLLEAIQTMPKGERTYWIPMLG